MRPIETGAKEQELLALFSGLTEEQQDAVLNLIRVMEN